MAQVSGRGRRVQIVGVALALVLAAFLGNGGGDDSDQQVMGFATQDLNAGASVETIRVSQLVADGVDGPRTEEKVVADPEKDSAGSDPDEPDDDTEAGPEKKVPQHKVIYLTFDDGPSAAYTKRILRLLDEYDAKATFFQLGENATAHPELTRSVVARGHALGSHTWNHKDLRRLPPSRLKRQITRTSAVLSRISGQPITCLRPPYGAVNARVKSSIRRKELSMKLWDIDPRDWKRPGAAAIAKRVVSHAHAGAVSLMHDGGGNRSQSVRALKRILRSLDKKGYGFETLPGC